MNKPGIVLLGLLTFLMWSYSHAQDVENVVFTPDQEGFSKQLIEFLKPAPEKQKTELVSAFNEFIKTYKPEENEWMELASFANSLIQAGVKPYPQFHSFLLACCSFKTGRLDPLSLFNWLNYSRIKMETGAMSLLEAEQIWNFLTSFNENWIAFDSGPVKWILNSTGNQIQADTSLFLKFSEGSITGIAGNESSVITSIKGRYYPAERRFYSETGTLDWSTTGLAPGLVFARLFDFELDLSKSVYTIDSVQLSDTRYFEAPISGRLDHKIATGLPPERRGYPRFTSSSRRNQIKDIYPHMDYTGGFSLQGRKVVGEDLNHQKGTLLVYYQGLPKLRLASDYFVFTPERAQGVNTEISFYLHQDSIFHPGLSFQYQKSSDEIALMRDGQGLSESRFFDTYHQLDLDADMITWNPSDSILILSGMIGSLNSKASFESADYYSIERFNEIQVADLVNPLVAVKQCFTKFNSRFFTAGDLSEFMKRPHNLVVEMLLNISFYGFVRYDSNTDLVEVNQRCFDFLAKHAELQDFDIIEFLSDTEPKVPNAQIDIKTGLLRVDGVKKIDFSLERNVTAYPSGNYVLIGKNRGIQFDGNLQSGLVGFSGTGFELIYDDFELNMKHIDKIRIQVHIPVNGNYSKTEIKNISSIIENTSGVLKIDEPENKSGMKAEEYPQYPMFIADTSAYVYYDQVFIQNGAYSRENFFFQSDSLVMSGLNSKYLKDSLSFPGKFITAGIFPEINVDLQYQEDQSLGFATLYTPDTGYQIYGGKGRFYNEINMSAEGLTGNGFMEYLGASLKSEKFLFLPDEMRSLVNTIAIREDSAVGGTPKATGDKVSIRWNPKLDQMVANQEEGLLSLYDGIVFDGDVYIQPDGLKGKGFLGLPGFNVRSDSFNFFPKRFTADVATLSLMSDFQDSARDNSARSADLIAINSSIDVDLKDSVILSNSINNQSLLRFPENKFRARYKNLKWQIGTDRVDFSEPELISELATQNGLNMKGTRARFNKSLYQLDLDGLEYLDIADVRIFPSLKKARIQTNAFIDTLPDCSIVPLDTSLRHRIDDASVFVLGKTDYHASGHYTFLDKAQREFDIFMDRIRVQKNGISEGEGSVSANDGFYISPEFAFQGTIKMKMNEGFLNFDGAFKLAHDCISNTPKWVRMNAPVDPLNVFLPIDQNSKDLDGEKVYSGFFLSNQPIELYSTYLGPHTRYSDVPVLEASGWVQFDEEKGIYRLGSKEKLLQIGLVETELQLGRNDCVIRGEGPLSLGIDLGQMSLKAAGTAQHDLSKDSLSFQTVLGVDFFLNDKALEFMAKELNNFSKARAVNYSDPGFRRSLLFYLGNEIGTELLNQLSLTGGFKKFPEEMNQTILFTQLQLKWNPDRGSYQSVGKIGIGNISNKPVNKFFDGKLEITHRRGGDSFTLYLETEPGSYFFFNYSRGLMQVLAGPKYEKFNEMIRDTKEDKRKLSVSGSAAAYQYYLGQYRLVRNFLDEITEE